MKTFTKVYWGIWALGLIGAIFMEMNAKAGEGPGLVLFLYFGVTVVAALIYGVIFLVAGKSK
jgi:hypothetical protein